MEDLEILRKRLLYQSQHRGMKEMDIILGKFAQENLCSMGFEELKDFEALLAFPDQNLYKWVFEKETLLDNVFCPLVLKIQQSLVRK